MTKDEFQKRIDLIGDKLWETYICYSGVTETLNTYLCYEIEDYLGTGASDYFKYIFEGVEDNHLYGMFGRCDSFKNQETRFDALNIFEQMCLTTGEYKEFYGMAI